MQLTVSVSAARAVSSLLMLCLLAEADASGESPTCRLRLADAQVVDIKRRTILPGRDLYLSDDGRILEVREHGTNDLCPDVPTIDVAERYVMPGLVDAHVHASQLLYPDTCVECACSWNWFKNAEPLDMRQIGRMMLRAGVTAFVDMASLPQGRMYRLRAQQREGTLPYAAPDIYTAGAFLTSKWGKYLGYPGAPTLGGEPSDHVQFLEKMAETGTPYSGNSTHGFKVDERAGEIQRVVLPVLAARPDVIKISYSWLTDSRKGQEPAPHLDTIERIVKIADIVGVPVFVHSQTPQGHVELIEKGVNGFAHLGMYGWKKPVHKWERLDLTDKRVYVHTTVSPLRSLWKLRDGDLQDPFLGKVLAELGDKGVRYLDSFEQALNNRESCASQYAEHIEEIYEKGLEIGPGLPREQPVFESARRYRGKTKALYDRQTESRRAGSAAKRDGLILLAGTDAPNFGVTFGFGLHQELEALVQDVGFSTWEALESATILPGELLDVPYGTEQGSIANLLILSENPVEDIHNLRTIVHVILRGEVYWPSGNR